MVQAELMEQRFERITKLSGLLIVGAKTMQDWFAGSLAKASMNYTFLALGCSSNQRFNKH